MSPATSVIIVKNQDDQIRDKIVTSIRDTAVGENGASSVTGHILSAGVSR